MRESQAVLLMLLSKALFGRTIEVRDIDSDELLNEAKSQAVIQLAYEALDKSLLSSEAATLWKESASKDIAKNIRVTYNHELMHQWLSEADIPYVILKGCSSAHYYPTPLYRSLGDVDFLVPSEYLEKTGKVLEDHGLKPSDQEHISHIVYRKQGMHLEMHFNLAGTPHGEAGDLVRSYMTDVYEQSSLCKIGNGEAVLPSLFHHGLILLLHTCHHLTGEGIGLRHLCDWAVFENHFSDAEFKGLFEEKLKKIGLWRFAQVLTRISINYLGAEEKAWAVCEEELAEQLMEDILTGGNFGRKDSNRSMQTLMISDRGKSGVGNVRMLTQLRKSGNNIIYTKWPNARNNKLLLPAGWVYFGGRRVIRELTGKRKKTQISNIVSGASSRRKLYKQLHLYEKCQ